MKEWIDENPAIFYTLVCAIIMLVAILAVIIYNNPTVIDVDTITKVADPRGLHI